MQRLYNISCAITVTKIIFERNFDYALCPTLFVTQLGS